ncbi:MAG: amidohydrolase 2 [Armatimonadetes bacterium]|nr:amidohydrolase 2 [Armatimonadota bacterium]
MGSYIAHLVSLVCEGTFQRFPTLRFVMIEGGVSWLPAVLWRLDKNWKALRQTTPWLDRPPSEIVRDHVLLTTQPIEEPDRPEHLHRILEMFDAGRMLMFSTDFPHWDGDTPEFAGRWLPAAIRARVMSETARELYRLPQSHHVDQ